MLVTCFPGSGMAYNCYLNLKWGFTLCIFFLLLEKDVLFERSPKRTVLFERLPMMEILRLAWVPDHTTKD